ncbi:MAG: hypothetical protein RDV41_08450 [Planctomycetota bacterium]|nr:hypothetical protein [Planctomycetota bacterium]
MPIPFMCQSCGHFAFAPDCLAGKNCKCVCGTVVYIPNAILPASEVPKDTPIRSGLDRRVARPPADGKTQIPFPDRRSGGDRRQLAPTPIASSAARSATEPTPVMSPVARAASAPTPVAPPVARPAPSFPSAAPLRPGLPAIPQGVWVAAAVVVLAIIALAIVRRLDPPDEQFSDRTRDTRSTSAPRTTGPRTTEPVNDGNPVSRAQADFKALKESLEQSQSNHSACLQLLRRHEGRFESVPELETEYQALLAQYGKSVDDEAEALFKERSGRASRLEQEGRYGEAIATLSDIPLELDESGRWNDETARERKRLENAARTEWCNLSSEITRLSVECKWEEAEKAALRGVRSGVSGIREEAETLLEMIRNTRGVTGTAEPATPSGTGAPASQASLMKTLSALVPGHETDEGPARCPLCAETGRVKCTCRSCSGQGKLTCSACAGTKTQKCPNQFCANGVVPKSLANPDDITNVTCKLCEGRGKVPCVLCGGRAYYTCEACSGSGNTAWTCLLCGGVPLRHWTDSKGVCVRCSGSGHFKCMACRGKGATGRRVCGNCNSSSRTRCTKCLGSRRVTCLDCEGCGKERWCDADDDSSKARLIPCRVCKQVGMMPCSFCTDGNEECQACFGEGGKLVQCPHCGGSGQSPCDLCCGGPLWWERMPKGALLFVTPMARFLPTLNSGLTRLPCGDKFWWVLVIADNRSGREKIRFCEDTYFFLSSTGATIDGRATAAAVYRRKESKELQEFSARLCEDAPMLGMAPGIMDPGAVVPGTCGIFLFACSENVSRFAGDLEIKTRSEGDAQGPGPVIVMQHLARADVNSTARQLLLEAYWKLEHMKR